VLRASAVAVFVMASGGCAAESIVLELGPDESTAKLAAAGEVLAVGVAWHERYAVRGNIDYDGLSAVALVREGAPVVRTPLEPGVMRALVATPDGFAALRVRGAGQPDAAARVSLVDRDGRVADLPPMSMDALGIWVGADGAIHAYSGAAIVRWSAAEGAWRPVPLDPSVTAAPIVRMVALAGGRVAVIDDRRILGFARLGEPPLFAKDMGAYPYPLHLFAGEDGWWLAVSGEREQKLVRVEADGSMREVTTLRRARVLNVMASAGEVVVARVERDVHGRSFQVLRPGAGSPRRPRRLPDDVMQTCLWKGGVVTGGAGQRVVKTLVSI
jgi:hypothetical protein